MITRIGVWRLIRVAGLACVLLAACRESGVVAQHRVPGGDPRRGAMAIVSYGCGSCHVIPGIPAARGHVGPPLTDFADRVFIAGRVRNEPASLVRWILNPQVVDSATAMPNVGVSAPDAHHIAAYLYTLRADRLGPPSPLSSRLIPSH